MLMLSFKRWVMIVMEPLTELGIFALRAAAGALVTWIRYSAEVHGCEQWSPNQGTTLQDVTY